MDVQDVGAEAPQHPGQVRDQGQLDPGGRVTRDRDDRHVLAGAADQGLPRAAEKSFADLEAEEAKRADQ